VNLTKENRKPLKRIVAMPFAHGIEQGHVVGGG
jgi:hypothetical protein